MYGHVSGLFFFPLAKLERFLKNLVALDCDRELPVGSGVRLRIGAGLITYLELGRTRTNASSGAAGIRMTSTRRRAGAHERIEGGGRPVKLRVEIDEAAKIRTGSRNRNRPQLPGLTPQPSIGQRMFSARSLRSLHRLFSTTSHRRADPWPLPHTRQHIEATTIPSNIPKPIPIPRHNESLETLRARLTYQTRKRGTLESDLIMSTFAKEHLHSLTREELVELDQVTYPETGRAFSSPSVSETDWNRTQLLDEPDWDVYYWCTEGKAPPERWANSPILAKLKIHARNEGKAVRRMPNLEPPQRPS